jgi:hypothetical protein
MKCSLLTLSCALDGELSRERQLELDAHLITCERCKTGMRYLREETERISLLAPVRLTTDKATALLERSRVLVSVTGSPRLPSVDPIAEDFDEPLLAAPDPFGAHGIGAAILEVPATPEPAADPPPFEVEEETSADPAAEKPELEHGSAFDADEADRSGSDALAAVPEELWLADTADEVATESTTITPIPADDVGKSIFAAEDTDSSYEPPPSIEPPSTPEDEPSKEARPSTMVVPGWEPATELKMPWGDLPPATPAADTWAPHVTALTGLPVSRQTPLPSGAPLPATSPPSRPAEAAVPGLQADHKANSSDREPPRRSGGSGLRRPSSPKPGTDGPEPRSWTRTGLIAVAALAAVLIVWNVTHGSKPAGVHHPQSKATPAVSAKPSPAASATPSTTAPLALTGTQVVGSTGSGYQVQSVQYGLHGSQFWVVFHFTGGSGVPMIASGFSGSQTIYLEMEGVAPGTQVAQPASGSLVSSIAVGHATDFSGAVYVLHLSRAAQITPSALTGHEAGAPGYLAIIQ